MPISSPGNSCVYIGKFIVYRPAGKEPGVSASEIAAERKRAPVNPEFDPSRHGTR